MVLPDPSVGMAATLSVLLALGCFSHLRMTFSVPYCTSLCGTAPFEVTIVAFMVLGLLDTAAGAFIKLLFLGVTVELAVEFCCCSFRAPCVLGQQSPGNSSEALWSSLPLMHARMWPLLLQPQFVFLLYQGSLLAMLAVSLFLPFLRLMTF